MLSRGLRPVVQTYYDNQMFNRLRKTVYAAMLANTEIPKGHKNLWEGDIAQMDGFEFNLDSLYTQYCQVKPSCSLTGANEVRLETEGFVPKTCVQWLASAQRAEICYLVSAYKKEKYRPFQQEVFKLDIAPTRTPVAGQTFFSSPLPPPCFVLISTCVLYFKEDAVLGAICLNQKTLHPAKIEKALRVVPV